MASKANIKLVVLWEDELREGARLLKKALNEKDESEQWKLCAAALKALSVALDGVDDKAALVLSRNPFPKAVTKEEV